MLNRGRCCQQRKYLLGSPSHFKISEGVFIFSKQYYTSSARNHIARGDHAGQDCWDSSMSHLMKSHKIPSWWSCVNHKLRDPNPNLSALKFPMCPCKIPTLLLFCCWGNKLPFLGGWFGNTLLKLFGPFHQGISLSRT